MGHEPPPPAPGDVWRNERGDILMVMDCLAPVYVPLFQALHSMEIEAGSLLCYTAIPWGRYLQAYNARGWLHPILPSYDRILAALIRILEEIRIGRLYLEMPVSKAPMIDQNLSDPENPALVTWLITNEWGIHRDLNEPMILKRILHSEERHALRPDLDYIDLPIDHFPSRQILPIVFQDEKKRGPLSLIVDPFAGINASARCARGIGVRFSGCEINPRRAAVILDFWQEAGLSPSIYMKVDPRMWGKP